MLLEKDEPSPKLLTHLRGVRVTITKPMQDKVPETIETITRNVQQITSLVNDILFVQEMELILEKFGPVNLVNLARGVAERYMEKAQARNIKIRVKPDLFIPPVMGDISSLERALISLVDNAVKFSPDNGEVDIRLRRKGEQVALSVRDQGEGIASEALPHIFDRFFHLDKSGDRLFEGLGIGLAITKQVIEQHLGHLDVESTPGQGSTFTMWLNIGRENGKPKESGTTI
jgi:signal transduction histidine kinase